MKKWRPKQVRQLGQDHIVSESWSSSSNPVCLLELPYSSLFPAWLLGCPLRKGMPLPPCQTITLLLFLQDVAQGTLLLWHFPCPLPCSTPAAPVSPFLLVTPHPSLPSCGLWFNHDSAGGPGAFFVSPFELWFFPHLQNGAKKAPPFVRSGEICTNLSQAPTEALTSCYYNYLFKCLFLLLDWKAGTDSGLSFPLTPSVALKRY